LLQLVCICDNNERV